MSKLDDKKEHWINDLTLILNSELELFEHMISGFSKNYILTTFSDHQHCTYIINTDKTTFNMFLIYLVRKKRIISIVFCEYLVYFCLVLMYRLAHLIVIRMRLKVRKIARGFIRSSNIRSENSFKMGRSQILKVYVFFIVRSKGRHTKYMSNHFYLCCHPSALSTGFNKILKKGENGDFFSFCPLSELRGWGVRA